MKRLSFGKSVQALWGNDSEKAFELVQRRLLEKCFVGPLSFRQKANIPFMLDPSPTVRVVLSLSRIAGGVDFSTFDTIATIWSKTIYDKTISTDPWYPPGAGYESWNQDRIPCLAIRLSYLKWCQRPSEENPAWALTVNSAVKGNIEEWWLDLELLLLPLLFGLTSDKSLLDLLRSNLLPNRPQWVKSTPPSFANLSDLLAALQRR